MFSRAPARNSFGTGSYACAITAPPGRKPYVLDTELMTYLRERLPAYMVPSAIVVLDALPRTPNDKVDLNALPAVTVQPGMDGAPRDDLERELADVWRQVLELDDVGIHDDFFDLDGNSLQVIRLVSHIQRSHGVGIPAEDVFEHSTVATLAARVRAERDANGERP